MEQSGSSLDAGNVSDTASQVVAQADGPAGVAVEVLARSVINYLVSHSRRWSAVDVPEVSVESLSAFCAALNQPTPEAALQFISQRRKEGISRQGVYLTYICDAARRLGDSWDQDSLSFLGVTIASGHLYAVMRALQADGPSEALPIDSRRCALFATVPGEDHGVGVTVAAAFFRDLGWTIDLRLNTQHDSLITHVARSQPPVIGLSLSTWKSMQALKGLVSAMREVAPHAIIGVAPGQTVERRKFWKLVDIDLVIADAHLAFIELERLILLRGWPK